ncbi:hypothetical protein BRC81_04320 [Halobacteriales archaeon QS_1_68_20]|nr:MAG: hypothetical protein BRC81_04320 [Halobacteriales archaeon QS_1_68_20]
MAPTVRRRRYLRGFGASLGAVAVAGVAPASDHAGPGVAWEKRYSLDETGRFHAAVRLEADRFALVGTRWTDSRPPSDSPRAPVAAAVEAGGDHNWTWMPRLESRQAALDATPRATETW